MLQYLYTVASCYVHPLTYPLGYNIHVSSQSKLFLCKRFWADFILHKSDGVSSNDIML